MLKLINGLDRYHNILILGLTGTGKTTLVHQLIRHTTALADFTVAYFYGFDIDLDRTRLIEFQNTIGNSERQLLIIDELESIRSTEVMDSVVKRIKEGGKYGAKTILVSRTKHLPSEIISNSYVIDLNESLSEDEIQEFIRLKFPDVNEDKMQKVASALADFDNSPRTIQAALQLVEFNNGSVLELRSLLSEELRYKNPLIYSAFEGDRLILPETPQIITDLRFVNQSLLQKIKSNPKAIYQISPRQFEELVAEIFEKKGYHVKITQQTRDGGKDLIILENGLLGNFLCYLECKQHIPTNPVGVKVVRELFGTVMADRATAGVVVTSSYFSDDARMFTEKVKHQMDLIDYTKLTSIIDQINS